jgi:hypothetical protein
VRNKDPTRDSEIVRLYMSGKFLPEHIAHPFGLSVRRIQQIAKDHGVIHTHAEANRLATPLKRQRRIRRAKTHHRLP